MSPSNNCNRFVAPEGYREYLKTPHIDALHNAEINVMADFRDLLRKALEVV
jgi:hypothetical protein